MSERELPFSDTLKATCPDPYHLTSDEYRCRTCGVVWGVDEPRPMCHRAPVPATESTYMKYSLYTFPTREEARAWLHAGGWGTVDRPNVPGLWANGTHTAQAFKNLSGTWTVQRYAEPDPADFITE